jgi:hypothetical protein
LVRKWKNIGKLIISSCLPQNSPLKKKINTFFRAAVGSVEAALKYRDEGLLC